MSLKTTEAIILAGGFGTRLSSVVQGIPKPMAPVQDRPFLEYLLQTLGTQGIKRTILSVGYKAAIVQERFGSKYSGMALSYSVETDPLGTGGGIRLALSQLHGSACFVLNGDSIFDLDYGAFESFHDQMGANLTLALKDVSALPGASSRYGRVLLHAGAQSGTASSATAWIKGFEEKKNTTLSPGETFLMNAGVYLFNRKFFETCAPLGKFSFEKDFMEVQAGKAAGVAGFVTEGYFIDIGIPEDYAKAQEESFFKSMKETAFT